LERDVKLMLNTTIGLQIVLLGKEIKIMRSI